MRNVLVLLLHLVLPALAWAGPPSASDTKPIQDDSFLIEEAYNQECGMVQHINTFQRVHSGDWVYTFTQEWPVPDQSHQLSITVPVVRMEGYPLKAGHRYTTMVSGL